MSVAKYTIVNPNDPYPFPESHKITVRVTSVESGLFFSRSNWDYMTCFWALDHKPQSTITIDFDWKIGVAAKDWTNVAKKGTIDVNLNGLGVLTLALSSLLSLYSVLTSSHWSWVFFNLKRDRKTE
ncbi:Transmembrane emp24 domain-containing protein p24delta9 [Camellia lanceoleosa]|uniref:Transmembrane emp24 domain-containing protein p24delta9 n=1 Tax=Camellia lanceoleosa TaxID=1840588 RepID=A0ACC0FY12_9ERIC|nr:Transmembrane emp24 domain-containing protein p24delta9 [Camellia lanceoleosa]